MYDCYLTLVLLFVIVNYVSYKIQSSCVKTEKQKAYLLTIKNALIMFTVSTIFLVTLMSNGGNIMDEYFDASLIGLRKMTILYFMAYLISDICIGAAEYNKYMMTLSGYPHHFIYLLICSYVLYSGDYTLFALFLVEELPTAILSMGSVVPELRSDALFGFTFALTRIIYHAFISYYLRDNIYLFCMSLAILGLHGYWFGAWLIKYKREILCQSVTNDVP